MLAALSAIAKQTALICNTCRTASEKSESASTKRNFVQLAKDIANGTAAVVQAVKVFTAHLITVLLIFTHTTLASKGISCRCVSVRLSHVVVLLEWLNVGSCNNADSPGTLVF